MNHKSAVFREPKFCGAEMAAQGELLNNNKSFEIEYPPTEYLMLHSMRQFSSTCELTVT
jgi:hypothetical protein